MRIEAIDLFYLAVPKVLPIGDGSQDTLLVRIRAGKFEGWGECEASPLPSIASFVCPMSHSACRPVRDSILGQKLSKPADIRRIGHLVRTNSFDLLQADHMLSGLDVAMWDLLGRKLGQPVYRLLGYTKSFPKLAYASALFGATANATFKKVVRVRQRGFRAVKLGWGPFGRKGLKFDRDQIAAAREAAGPACKLMIDAGTVWDSDMKAAQARLPYLKKAGVVWLEEPFSTHAYGSYRRLANTRPRVPLAGGEGSHNADMAKNMIDYGGIRFVQIDAGRAGGISAAKEIVDHARQRGVQFVNHTFTSNLALSASIQPYAGVEDHDICEYPVELSELAANLTATTITPDSNGYVRVPSSPGLGLAVNLATVARFHQKSELRVGHRVLFESPHLSAKP